MRSWVTNETREWWAPLGVGLTLGLTVALPTAHSAPADLYRLHCARCHGADRLGGLGPALLPENLGRLNRCKPCGRCVRVCRQARCQASPSS